MTPGLKQGHIGLTGKAFLLSGCNGGVSRQFAPRDFTISVGE